MIAAFIINCIAILLSWLARYRRWRVLLSASFVIYTVFLGIRYMWGNDMMNYYLMFDQINSIDNDLFNLNSIDYREGKEYGWIILNILCKPIGFLGMQMVLAVFQNYVVYSFIKRNVTPNWYWFATFLYGFGVNFMVLSASMMRQSLAMMIVLFASPYIAQKKIIPSVLLVLLAASMHQSALILLPFCFLGYLKINFKRKNLFWIAGALILWMILAEKVLSSIVSSLISSETFDNYEVYMGEFVESSGTGFVFLFNCFLTCMLLAHIRYVSSLEYKNVLILGSLAILFVPLMSFASLVTRLGYYFSLFTIAGYPIIMQNWIFNKYLKIVVIFFIILLNIRSFFAFFYSDVWYRSYFEYHTIFEDLHWI